MLTIEAPHKVLQLLKSPVFNGSRIPLLPVYPALFAAVVFIFSVVASEPQDLRPRLQLTFHTVKSNYLTTANLTNAILYARTCFDLADLSTNDEQRAFYANEGIPPARKGVEINPSVAPPFYYLALNTGQLAQTKHLGALKLVKQMESDFLKSIVLDPAYDHAGAHRSIGMLYRDTPGWPTSLGDKSKAREHLEKAVELAPDFPDNQLTLLESYLKWKDHAALQAGIDRYRKDSAGMKQKYNGPEWQLSWQDWNHRWNEILSKAAKL
jgi:tetratricopeptide (TPR) repeat protein